MELNRYENVETVISILDKRINKILKEDKLNPKELVTLIDIRTIYIKEYDGLTRSKNTREMYEKKSK